MTDVLDHEPRRRAGTTHGWSAWAGSASRVLLACLFALGMLGPTSRARAATEAEPEPTMEIGEDGEVDSGEDEQVRVVRRRASHGGGARWAHGGIHGRPPAQIEPTVPAPTPPRWQRPRRAPPPGDDDGPSLG